MKKYLNLLKSYDRQFLLFMAVSVCLGVAQAIDGSAMTNFYKEKFHFLISERSMLEIPRELPGFLVFLLTGMLFSLGDIRIAALANVFAAIGLFSLGIIPEKYGIMLIFVFIYSAGQHIYMPLSNSIGMSFAKKENYGRMLGQLAAANTVALVISAGILIPLFRFAHLSFRGAFTIGAVFFIAAAILLMKMRPEQAPKGKSRFVFRKQYSLYYWLCMLYGARKQIFITFGPWVLVDVFNLSVSTMTALFFLISVLNIFVRPAVGSLIDKVGEKFVLGSEAVILIFVCLGYVCAARFFSGNAAAAIAAACYVMDMLMTAVGMARSTYLKKIAVSPEDVSPTLSLGISIDHIMSMFLPVLGGMIWTMGGSTGYQYVFACGAVIALINFISVQRIRIAKA